MWPARSCSSRAIRRRSSATACSARACRACSSLNDQGLLAVQQPTDRECEGVGHDPGLPADVLLRRQELGDDPRRCRGEGGDQGGPEGRFDVCRHVQDHQHAEEQHRFEYLADADDYEDRDDDEEGEHLGGRRARRSWNTKAATAGDTINRSSAVPGSVSWAMVVTATAAKTRKPRSSRRSAASWPRVVSASRDVSSTTTRLRRARSPRRRPWVRTTPYDRGWSQHPQSGEDPCHYADLGKNRVGC